jgi:hypothetical protein
MVTTTVTATTSITTTNRPATNIPSLRTSSAADTVRQRIMDSLNTAMHCQGGENPEGGGGPAPVTPAVNPTALVPPAANVRTMGTLPAIFTGNRAKSQEFLDELRGYFQVNQRVVGFNSFI